VVKDEARKIANFPDPDEYRLKLHLLVVGFSCMEQTMLFDYTSTVRRMMEESCPDGAKKCGLFGMEGETQRLRG
jgi:hypothetical protein